MMGPVFISDLHLSPQTPALWAGLQRFYREIGSQASALYILGDFFDAWIGDDDDSAFAQEVKSWFKSVTAKTPVFFLAGNRDFLVGEALAHQCGFKLLNDETVITVNGQRLLLLHGDSLCTDDKEYQQFRALVHSSAWQQQVLALPLAQRRLLAQDLRQKSKMLSASKTEDIMDVNLDAVTEIAETYRVKWIIHGHTHRPAHHVSPFKNSQLHRIVLGDWHAQMEYLQASDAGLELKSFSLTAA